ncbi:MAG: helix-turn-helix domain-containing protein [Nitrososphaerales archaeon]
MSTFLEDLISDKDQGQPGHAVAKLLVNTIDHLAEDQRRRLLVSALESLVEHERRPPLMTVRQASRCSGLTERFMKRLVEERRIPYAKPGKYILIKPDDIDRLLADATVTTSCRHSQGKMRRAM